MDLEFLVGTLHCDIIHLRSFEVVQYSMYMFPEHGRNKEGLEAFHRGIVPLQIDIACRRSPSGAPSASDIK